MERLSKSELKRQHKQVEAAAKEITVLNDAELTRLQLDSETIEAVRICRTLKGGALKRQVKYVAKLLKQGEVDALLSALALMKGSRLAENKAHHQAERLRDAIINEALDFRDVCLQEGATMEMDWPSETLEHLVKEFVDIDELELRRSAYQYARTRNRVHSREIFRILRAAAEKQRYTDRA
jgi:ribosome-associated protein